MASYEVASSGFRGRGSEDQPDAQGPRYVAGIAEALPQVLLQGKLAMCTMIVLEKCRCKCQRDAAVLTAPCAPSRMAPLLCIASELTVVSVPISSSF